MTAKTLAAINATDTYLGREVALHATGTLIGLTVISGKTAHVTLAVDAETVVEVGSK